MSPTTLTYGQMILREADTFSGVAEATGRNDGARIRALQIEAARALGYDDNTYLGAPYCAIGVGHNVRTSGMPHDPNLVHPATAYMCAQARREGILFDAPKLVPPGAFMIRCGVHTGHVVQDHGATFYAFEFNHNNRCDYTWRSKADWDFIVPKPLKDEPAPRVILVPRYGFDDLSIKPRLLGGWSTERIRRTQRERFEAANPGWWTQDVRINRPSPFAFRAGAPGTWSSPWEFGGWQTPEIREEKFEAYAARVGHRNLRIWRKNVPIHLDATGTPISAGSGTTT